VVLFLIIIIHIFIGKLVQVKKINSSFYSIILSLVANNLFLRFTFTKDLNREAFPSKITVILNTVIENMFLEKSPTTISSDDVVSIQSNPLVFEFDSTHFRPFDGIQTIATFSLIGGTDFGFLVENISIWQDRLDLSVLNRIQLKDDIREWNEEYQPCLSINRFFISF